MTAVTAVCRVMEQIDREISVEGMAVSGWWHWRTASCPPGTLEGTRKTQGCRLLCRQPFAWDRSHTRAANCQSVGQCRWEAAVHLWSII